MLTQTSEASLTQSPYLCFFFPLPAELNVCLLLIIDNDYIFLSPIPPPS